MQESDFERFAAVMFGLAENYGQTLTEYGVALRFKALQAWSIEEIERAAIAIIVTRKYTTMPTVADFMEHISGGSAEDKAEVEAGKVLMAIAKHGFYSSVVFDDAVTQAVIVLAYGGWMQLCQDCGVVEPEKWFRKDFARIWAAYSRQGIKQGGHLPGFFEVSNYSKGIIDEVPPPIMIGDPEKAMAVLEAGTALNSFQSLEADKKMLPEDTAVRRAHSASNEEAGEAFTDFLTKTREGN